MVAGYAMAHYGEANGYSVVRTILNERGVSL